MTKEKYLQIREFALKTRWNQLYDSWGGVHGDIAELKGNLLNVITDIDKTFGNTPHRNSVTLEVDVVTSTQFKTESPKHNSVLRQLWHRLQPQKMNMITLSETPIRPDETAHSWLIRIGI